MAVILQKRAIEELLEQQENIVCFGSGKAFVYIVENDSPKWGKPKYVEDRKIPIVSPDFFMTQ